MSGSYNRNRLIQVRAWDAVYSKMLYSVDLVAMDIFLDPGGYGFVKVTSDKLNRSYHYLNCEVRIMQFIGVKDKHGKKIFEEDIVKHKNGIYEVWYDEDNYRFQMGLLGDTLDQEVGAKGEIEVLGNRWETPELLKECVEGGK